MGIKISKPKIKVKAPKSISKAISSTTKAIGNVAKGDLKGAAASVGELAQAGKDFTKDIGSANLRNITGALGSVGAATGLNPLQDLASNVNREGQSGINKYGDVAIDTTANIATGGTYGATQQALGALAQGGVGGLFNPESIKQAAMSYGSSQLGIDPNMLQSAQQIASGDLRGAALQQLGSMAGFDPKQLQMGLSAITGNKAGLASGLASQFGAGDTASSMIGQFAGGKGAREVISDQAGAYANDEVNQALDRAGVSREGVKQLENQIRRAPAALKEAAEQQYKIAKGDSFNAIAKKLGVSPEALKAANPQLKDINKIATGASLNIPLKGETLEQTTARRAAADQRALANQPQEPGLFERMKRGVGSAFGSAKDFLAENKTGLGLGADVLAAGAGFMAGEAGRKEAKGLSEQQLKELKGTGAAFEKMQYDPERYKQEREFLQQRIAGGGITAEEKKMQQEGDIRAARAAAAQRLAGMEQQARMGAGATGAGTGLAAALAGGQAAMSEQSAANLAREASASQRLEQDIQRQTNLARQQTAEEAQLTQEQGQFGLQRAQQTGAVRGDLGNLALGRAAALQNLAGSGAEFAKQGLSMMEASQQPTQPQQPAQQPQQTPPPLSQAKKNAARRMSMGPKQKTTQPTTSQPQAAKQFNQTNIPVGIAAPVQQAAQKVQSTVDQAKQKAEEFKNNPLGALGIKF